jgi:hypothetical protein
MVISIVALVTLVAAGKVPSKVPNKAGSVAPTSASSTCRHLMTRDNFLPAAQAAALRATFVSRFAEPRGTASNRFVWDNWHCGEQYNLVRTPAQPFFGDKAYAELCDQITAFGQRELGCETITPPWLSYYVDGCSQALHTDAWHGPFAYVLSLTEWEGRAFTGGETRIMRREILDFWRGYKQGDAIEQASIFEEIEPLFNRLTVFDPRIPHGVKEVRGTRDPLKGRLVLHGWFTPAETVTFSGGLSAEQAEPSLNEALEPLFEVLGSECARMLGTLNLHVAIDGAGAVRKVTVLADTLVADREELVGGLEEEELRAENIAAVVSALEGAKFPPSKGGGATDIFVPFAFN